MELVYSYPRTDLPRCSKAEGALLIRHFGKIGDEVQAGYDHGDGPADESHFWPAICMPYNHSMEGCWDF
jgi:hypothetical protein